MNSVVGRIEQMYWDVLDERDPAIAQKEAGERALKTERRSFSRTRSESKKSSKVFYFSSFRIVIGEC